MAFTKSGRLIAFFSCLLSSSLFAITEEDKSQIKEIVAGYTTAWNENGGHGFADGFAEDADFINIFGMRFSGREEIEKRHVKILEGFLKNSILHIENIELREPTQGTVVALVHWGLTGENSVGISKGVFTHVLVKKGEHWEIAACQNTVIRSAP